MPVAEMIRDAVMNVIRGKPVHPRELDWHPLQDLCVDVFPRECPALRQGFIAYSSDQPHAPLFLESSLN